MSRSLSYNILEKLGSAIVERWIIKRSKHIYKTARRTHERELQAINTHGRGRLLRLACPYLMASDTWYVVDPHVTEQILQALALWLAVPNLQFWYIVEVYGEAYPKMCCAVDEFSNPQKRR